MLLDCQPLSFLAADLSAARATSPLKTRVRGCALKPSGRLSRRRRRSHETATGSARCGYKLASGRAEWPSRDPSEERGGLNLYAAVGNDPINFFDPNGRTPTSTNSTTTLQNPWGQPGVPGSIPGNITQYNLPPYNPPNLHQPCHRCPAVVSVHGEDNHSTSGHLKAKLVFDWRLRDDSLDIQWTTCQRNAQGNMVCGLASDSHNSPTWQINVAPANTEVSIALDANINWLSCDGPNSTWEPHSKIQNFNCTTEVHSFGMGVFGFIYHVWKCFPAN